MGPARRCVLEAGTVTCDEPGILAEFDFDDDNEDTKRVAVENVEG